MRSQPQVDVGDALRLIAVHCRYASTMIPRGVVGVEAALEYLHRLPDACRRSIPDLTGTAPKLARTATGFDLLATLPSEKVARALPRLISSVSPVVERRSDRVWTCWIARLLDPDMQARLRGRTPASQLRITAELGDEPALSRRALKRELEVAEDGRKQALAERDQLARELEAERGRAAELQRLEQQRSAREDLVGALRREVTALRGAVGSLRARESELLEDIKRFRSVVQFWEGTAHSARDAMTQTIARVDLLQATSASVFEELLLYHGHMNQPLCPELWWRPGWYMGLPGWYAAARGCVFWIVAFNQDEPEIPTLGVVTGDGKTHFYARGRLGGLMLATRLLHAGYAHLEACAGAGVDAI